MTLAVRIEEQELDRLAIELFTNHETHFTPTAPWVFVRVVPREQRIGLIWTPDAKQNKPVHEGIVLALWKPYTQRWREKHNGEWIDCEKEVHSDFNIGDHVTYPHYAGMDAAGWDPKYYRLVPEHTRAHRGIDSNGIIFGKLNYPKMNVYQRLHQIVNGAAENHPMHAVSITVDNITKEFDVISKDVYSKTVSGK